MTQVNSIETDYSLLKQIIEKLEQIEYTLNGHTHLLKLLLKRDTTPKLELLEEEVKKKGFMNSGQVENLLGVSRPWAIRLMQRLSKINPNVVFMTGNSDRQQPCRIRYAKDPTYNNFEKIKRMLDEKESVSMAELKQAFDLPYKEARLLADSFCDNYSDFMVDESASVYDNVPKELGVKIIFRNIPINKSINS